MEEKIAIVTDTNTGISAKQAEAYGVHLVAMPVIVDNETYYENVSIDQEEFFKRLKQALAHLSRLRATCFVFGSLCWRDMKKSFISPCPADFPAAVKVQ